MLGKFIGALAVFAVYGLYLGGFIGWAYWIWMAFHLGSFGMFVFGILGPLAIVASGIGLWSFVFGIPV